MRVRFDREEWAEWRELWPFDCLLYVLCWIACFWVIDLVIVLGCVRFERASSAA